MAAKLVVVKVGTSSLSKKNGNLDLSYVSKLVEQIVEVSRLGHRIILVSSGAIASGMAELGLNPKPNDIIFKQACAATGQSILMSYYREIFDQYDLKVAQVLLTEENLSNRVSYIHICNVLDRLLQFNVIPIINENDVTSVNEIIPVMKGYKVNFSDNDLLSVLIANATGADLVIILTTVNGLYSQDPQKKGAKLIHFVDTIDPAFKSSVRGKNRLGRGGIKTKIAAAEIAMRSGIPLVIANSRRKNVIPDILAGQKIGTFFRPNEKGLSGIKRWIAYSAGTKGQICVNSGAKNAIIKGASLLAAGIEDVSGTFQIGDVVSLVGPEGEEFARGIANYTCEEVNLIKGLGTSRIRKILGYIRQKEIVLRKRMHLADLD